MKNLSEAEKDVEVEGEEENKETASIDVEEEK